MNPYLEAFRACMQVIDDAADAEKNPHRRAILDNFLRHAALEFSGQDALILNTDMTVDEPIYHVKWGPDLTTYTGMDAVAGYYNGVNQVICTFQDHECWVNDWGIASYSTFVRFTTGEQLAAEGQDIPKPDDTQYAQHLPMAMFWKYTADAKLFGEDVFMLADPTHVEMKDDELFEKHELEAVAKSFVKS